MLQITADVFSGRPQPSWIVDDDAEARAILRLLAETASPDAEADPARTGGLGLRGFVLETLGDELAGQPATAYLGLSTQVTDVRLELAERLIASSEGAAAPQSAPADALALESPLRQFLGEELERIAGLGSQTVSAPDQRPAPAGEDAAAAVTCYYDRTAFNPGFWNNDNTVLRNNNCYNYASNWRTDTFAQPGRGSGAMYTAITCPEVTRGALSDGMHRRYVCFPDSERPRNLVALVIAPGPGFVDYHWYRFHSDGFWGHKPGGTAARNLDNSGAVIWNPETANRGPYTQFCGYFYGCNSQRRRIR